AGGGRGGGGRVGRAPGGGPAPPRLGEGLRRELVDEVELGAHVGEVDRRRDDNRSGHHDARELLAVRVLVVGLSRSSSRRRPRRPPCSVLPRSPAPAERSPCPDRDPYG